jgi:RNA polymerase sigma factor (sigma-70 family)
MQDQKYFPLRFWTVLRKTPDTLLHLVDDAGQPVKTDVRKAVESAFRRAVRRFRSVDEAVLAGMAESVAASITRRRSEIRAVKQYAVVAVDGRVRDWLRRHPRLEIAGCETTELERALGGAADSAIVDVETKRLFDQMKARLSERDRHILVLIEQDRGSPRDVAEALGLTYTAAAKAIQRAKERVAEILSSSGVHRHGGIKGV